MTHLVLRRKREESIVIGAKIVVTVLGIEESGQVRIGIEAPPDIRIVRGELATPPAQPGGRNG